MGRSKPTTIDARRTRVAMVLAQHPGIGVRRLARLVGCSQATAARDVQAIRAEWRERRQELVDAIAAEDFARSDWLIALLWPAIEAGNLHAFVRLVQVLTYRFKALGLDRQQRREPDIGDVLAQYLAEVTAEREDGSPEGPAHHEDLETTG